MIDWVWGLIEQINLSWYTASASRVQSPIHFCIALPQMQEILRNPPKIGAISPLHSVWALKNLLQALSEMEILCISMSHIINLCFLGKPIKNLMKKLHYRFLKKEKINLKESRQNKSFHPQNKSGKLDVKFTALTLLFVIWLLANNLNWKQDINNHGFIKAAGGSRVCRKLRAASTFRRGSLGT